MPHLAQVRTKSAIKTLQANTGFRLKATDTAAVMDMGFDPQLCSEAL